MQEHCLSLTAIVRCKLRKEPLNPATRPHADDTWLTGVFLSRSAYKKDSKGTFPYRQCQNQTQGQSLRGPPTPFREVQKVNLSKKYL